MSLLIKRILMWKIILSFSSLAINVIWACPQQYCWGRAIRYKSFPTVLLGGFSLLSLTQKRKTTKHKNQNSQQQQTSNNKQTRNQKQQTNKKQETRNKPPLSKMSL
jgi:hypothetical protein